jgi:chromosome segregation ATPase
MEAEAIKSTLPDLVTAISDCVQHVSDQCLAKGLIPESVYKRVLESGGTSEDKARTLILAVKKSTETDSKCLEIFLKILDEQLPFGIKDKPLSKIRNEIAERTITEAGVPKCTPPQSIPSEELTKESFALPNYLLGRFEKAVREHERSITEKRLLEDRLQAKPANSDDGEREITDLKMKIEEIEKKIGELDMQVRRNRITVTTETQEWFTQLAKHHQQQTELAVREIEEAAQKKMEEQMKELEHKLEIQERDHKLEILKIDTQETKAKYIPQFDINPPDKFKRLGIAANKAINSIRYHISEHDPKYSKWRELGSKLGFSEENLDKIEASERSGDPAQYTSETPRYNPYFENNCIGKMIKQWLDSYPGDSRGSNSLYLLHTHGSRQH